VLHIITRITGHFVFWSLFSIACVLSAIRIALFCVDLYKLELENKLTELLTAPVKIGHLHAHLRRGLKPELILKDINILSAQTAKSTIALQEIRFGIDLWAMLKKQQIVPATWVTLVGVKLSIIHKADGSFSILGLQGGNNEQPLWLLQGRHYELLQSEITWLDQKNNHPSRTFKQVDIAIKNDFSKQSHQLNLLTQLPAAYGDNLRISAEFTGNFFTPTSLNAQWYIAGKNLHFSKLMMEELPFKLSIQAGSSDFKVWGTLQNSQLTELSGQINNQNLVLQRPDGKKLQLKRFDSHFEWRNQANSWDLLIDDLAIAFPDKTYPPIQFRLGSHNKAAEQIGATIQQLDLEAVQPLSQFFLPLLGTDLSGFKNLTGLNLKGKLSNTLIFVDLKQQQYAINGQFQHLSMATPAPYPHFQNLSGTLTGTQQQGVLTLNSQNVNFIAQPMFRAPLRIKQLSGQLHWQQSEKNWLLSGANLKLNTPYANSISQLKVTIPQDTKPVFMDLQTAFSNLNDVSHAKVYFPVTLMSPGLLQYLDEAFIKGQVKQGQLLIKGNLQDFPFKQNQGLFQVLFDAQNVTMKYAQGWPYFEQLDAQVLFKNDGLEVNVKQAQIETQNFAPLQIESAKITIPSFSDSQYVFVQQGLARADINAGLEFLRHTPLSLPLKAVSEQLSINGDTQINLDLKIPLTEQVKAKVTGDAHVSGTTLKVLAIDLPIDDLNGVFRFTQDGFFSDTLQAYGLGYPLQAKVSLKPDSTLISVEGRTGIKDLEQQFNLPAQEIAYGASNYTVQINLPFAETVPSNLTIRSDLEGVALTLPDSLAKSVTDKKDLELRFNLIDGTLLPISLNYDQQLKANVLFDKANKKLTAANLLFGNGEADMPLADKFKININQARFSAPVWLAVLNKMQADDSNKTQLLTELEIHTPQLDWVGQNMGRFDLALHHNGNAWQGMLDCQAAKGRIYIPQNKGMTDNKIKLAMEHIDLSGLIGVNLPKNTATALATKLPLFEINSQKLLLRGIDLGQLKLDSERLGTGVKFKNASVTAKDRSLSLNGDWQILNNKEITRLNAELIAENFGELLTKLNLNEDLKETDAKINLAWHWAGAPYQFALSRLSGTMDIHLDEGRISSIEPGFGRLLGVLAVEQWLRRLQLDFSDIYQEGLTFNEISGHFVLRNGKATTENLTVNAVPATINLTGEINLAEQTLDQYIAVIPKSSSAIPIAGTIMGSIATVMAQTITGEYEEGYYLRSKYWVKGKWNNLSVMPLHEQDGLLKKTWRGLTDFSWITQPKQDQKQ
jgi:uncharacterized protein (TIGR02099 family)